ncbi:MAG TPA: hypothetical protein PKC18_04815, partial [Lacipirellulaceae bacterium]|nr:hypothetical protein [Lacipirellulaceae bacterium]
RGLLESALLRPRNSFAYGAAKNLAALAACYAGGIVRNHPSLDENKRAALASCRAFLLINGLSIQATQDEKASAILALAASQTTEDDFAAWIRERLIPCGQ